jgi:ABC-type uncharacterized transport system fused permease/ATPase subunit
LSWRGLQSDALTPDDSRLKHPGDYATLNSYQPRDATAGELRLNAWNKPFFDAIERRDLDSFGFQLIVFAIIAIGLLTLNVAQTWLDQTAKVEMRKWLTRDLLLQ